MQKVGKDSFLRHAGIAAAIAVVFYLVFFNWMQHRREGKGPWQITFITDTGGAPSLDIQQPTFHLSHRIIFDGVKDPQTNLNQTVKFYQ
ncbi:MAG: hypothetical protein ACXWDN_16380, partial [Limisphaerales bacterium]